MALGALKMISEASSERCLGLASVKPEDERDFVGSAYEKVKGGLTQMLTLARTRVWP